MPRFTEPSGNDAADNALYEAVRASKTPVVLSTTETSIGGQTRISLPNDHLQYALTWFSFAVTLVVIYLAYHYRRPEEDGAKT